MPQPAQPAQKGRKAKKAQKAQAAQEAAQPYAYQQAYQQPGQPGGPQPMPVYVAAPYAMPEKKRGKGWIVAIVFIVCLFALTAFCVKTCTDSMSKISTGTSVSGTQGLTGSAIGVIDLSGTIQYDGSACSPEGLKELLDEVESNEYIKAIVLRVNSGGGTATAGEEMAEYLKKFSKPIVVSSASINASAAYEISAQADYIYVAKSTEIGAIGTVVQMTDLSGLFEKLGIKMEVISSAESKDSSYGYRALTPEEHTYYQNMVNQINDMFVENVAQGRKMDINQVRSLATGLVFTGADAVNNGLADAIGTREDAISKAAELAGVTSYSTTDLYLSNYDISSLSGLLGSSRTSIDDLVDLLKTKQDAKL